MADVRGARRVRRHDEFDPNRVAWVQLEQMQVVVYRNPVRSSDDKTELALGNDIESVAIIFFKNGRINLTLPLNRFTRPELDALKEVIDLAFTEAGPLIDELDRRAELARQEGNDTIARLYRTVPKVHVRQRVQPANGEGLQE